MKVTSFELDERRSNDFEAHPDFYCTRSRSSLNIKKREEKNRYRRLLLFRNSLTRIRTCLASKSVSKILQGDKQRDAENESIIMMIIVSVTLLAYAHPKELSGTYRGAASVTRENEREKQKSQMLSNSLIRG